ncbi:dihydroorotate oxidase [Streptococcus pyogenes]|nr:dihydroorotate oxidase [Streptococcus pyogenes]
MEVEKSQAASLVTKTGTHEVRPGNQEPRYADTRLGSINSKGLPNNGFRYYLDFVSDLAKTGKHKPHFLSVVGLSHNETETILKAIMASEYVGLVELNLS